jgi:uncharacterized protein with von Willebrand factor type A (vWA) domain
VWKDNRRRHAERTETWKLLHSYGGDYKVIFVGDASMSPFELTSIGGSVEHWNDETGLTWLQRVAATYDKSVWINPTPHRYWSYTPSIGLISRCFADRMFPLTLEGLDGAMRALLR